MFSNILTILLLTDVVIYFPPLKPAEIDYFLVIVKIHVLKSRHRYLESLMWIFKKAEPSLLQSSVLRLALRNPRPRR